MPFKNPHPLYSVWANMRQRCRNPNSPNYQHYGGRGIKVCYRWDSFHLFVEDMGPRPSPKHSIDRIDNDGDYNPENCRWATRTGQARNTRRTRKIEVDGSSYIAADLADIVGIKTESIANRAKKGMSLSEIMDPTKKVYPIASHSGDPSGVAKRVETSRGRAECRNGHPWPEFQKINKLNAVECVMCGRIKALKSQKKRRARARNAGDSYG